MYLLRKARRCLYSGDKEYLYIRITYGRCNQQDIPLGRLDRGEPQAIVQRWLETDKNLPDELRDFLHYQDVVDLYQAITQGYLWSRSKKELFMTFPRPWRNKARTK